MIARQSSPHDAANMKGKHMTIKQANSGIIYNASLIDGKPIVVIATYSNRNTKTGAMVQTYILRSDIDPRDA